MRAWMRMALACAALAGAGWAQWVSIGAMPPGQRDASGVTYQNAQGRLRLTVLEPGVIRVRFTPAPELARAGDDFSYALDPARPAADPAFRFASSSAGDALETAELTLRIARQPLRLSFFDRQGDRLDADAGDGMAYDAAEAAPGGQARVRVWKQLDADTHFFGLGEKTGALDKRGLKLGGSAWTMWNSDVFGYDNATDPLYADIPFLLVLEKRPGAAALAHGIFFDNTFRSNFDLGRASQRFYDFGAQGGELNYYFIAGPTPKQVLARYTALTGRMPLPPLWSLGYQQCRYSYYPASQVLDIAENFRRRHIPADGIWLDIAYMRGYRVFTWDPTGFAQPKPMLARLAQLGFHSVAIVDPGVKAEPGYAAFDSGMRAGIFAKYSDGRPFIGPVWPGPAAFPDFTNPAARAWWAGEIATFASTGLSGIWNDMNEPSVFNTPSGTMPDEIVFAGDGRPTTAAAMHNVFGQQMSRATRRGLLQRAPDQRPFVLTRATYAGGQRYAALWTGDNTADWSHLRHGITMLLNLGLSGFPYVGNDIGGFAGPTSADLWTRWAEAAAFFPFMRAHADIHSPRKEPWVFGPASEAANRVAIERRYAFLPYIYDAFHEAASDGQPMMRPLLLEFPNDPKTYSLDDEFLFGGDLLVAPILAPGTQERSVYLPAGDWYRLSANGAAQRFTGPATIQVTAEEAELPLFARGGGILFRAASGETAAASLAGPLILDVYSRTSTQRSYYEDDGESFGYRQGQTFERDIRYLPGAQTTEIDLGAARGAYRPRHPEVRIVLHDVGRPQRATLDGVSLASHALAYDAARRQLEIVIPQSGAAQRVVITEEGRRQRAEGRRQRVEGRHARRVCPGDGASLAAAGLSWRFASLAAEALVQFIGPR